MVRGQLSIKHADGTSITVPAENYQHDTDHKYMVFGKPFTGNISQVSLILVHHYLEGVNKAISKWRSDKTTYIVRWSNSNSGELISSHNINYLVFSDFIRQNLLFDAREFNLDDPICYWLDSSLDSSINFHVLEIGDNGPEPLIILDGTPSKQFGEDYPIKPKLDREGHIYTTLQPQLTKRIIKTRNQIVQNSHLSLESDFIFELRNIVNDVISLIDITLNQLYIKAEYSPEPGWKFNKEKLGLRHGRRLEDKLKWVYQITGIPLNIESEKEKLRNIRMIRNHLNHFDPPTFVVTLEEAVIWLNDIIHIGQILIKIRQAMKVAISTPLINLLLQKEIIFNPEHPFASRLPLVKGQTGYSTSVWK